MIRPLSLALFAISLLAPRLHAVPMRFLPWDDAVAARKMALQSGKGVTPLPVIHPHKRSKPLDGAAGEVPPRLVALDRKGPDGKPLSVEIKLSAALEAPLVLILEDPASPTGLRTFVVEDSPAKFPWGTVRFVNATAKPLLAKQEKTITALPPGWAPTDVALGGVSRNIGVQVVARDNLQEILYSSVWEYDPDVRKLAFIVPGTDERTGAIDFKIIPEDRRVAAAGAVP